MIYQDEHGQRYRLVPLEEPQFRGYDYEVIPVVEVSGSLYPQTVICRTWAVDQHGYRYRELGEKVYRPEE